MILDRKRKKKLRIISFTVLSIFFTCFILINCFTNEAYAEDVKQYQKKFKIAGKIKGAVILVGFAKDKKLIEKLLDRVIKEAEYTYNLLDANNPQSEIYKLNSIAGSKNRVKVSWQVLDAFKNAQMLSRWTDGVFDIVLSEGNYKDVDINYDDSTIKLKKSGNRVDFEAMINGYMADYIIKLVYMANMENAMVKVGNMFRGIGSSLYGPWKIEVEEIFAVAVRHAIKLTVSNTGIATIAASNYKKIHAMDFRNKQHIAPKCRGVTIVMSEASFAEGIAHTVFILGAEEGVEFLNRFQKARGLIVDSKGKFVKTEGM